MSTVPLDFLVQGFFHESVSPKPLSILLRPFQFFFKHSRRYSQLKVHRWQIRKFLIFFYHLWVVESTYRYIFFFKFTFRCLQSDSVAIKVFATGINKCERTNIIEWSFKIRGWEVFLAKDCLKMSMGTVCQINWLKLQMARCFFVKWSL